MVYSLGSPGIVVFCSCCSSRNHFSMKWWYCNQFSLFTLYMVPFWLLVDLLRFNPQQSRKCLQVQTKPANHCVHSVCLWPYLTVYITWSCDERLFISFDDSQRVYIASLQCCNQEGKYKVHIISSTCTMVILLLFPFYLKDATVTTWLLFMSGFRVHCSMVWRICLGPRTNTVITSVFMHCKPHQGSEAATRSLSRKHWKSIIQLLQKIHCKR